MKEVNQYQTDLYRLGADLVHVFGKRSNYGFKNAVDVKMAVDSISTISSLPHINVFVIVSGDRDFIHVLKALRQHGKMIIGVSPSGSVSEDFAALCDRFIKYDSLASAYSIVPDSLASEAPAKKLDLDAVRQALDLILEGRPEGIKGAQVKPLLRRELSQTFDESMYGFSRLTDLLRHLSETVRVVAHESGSDVTVYSASRSGPGSEKRVFSGSVQELIRLANLRFYKFDQDASRRREMLRRLYDLLIRDQPFRWDEVQQQMLAENGERDDSLTVTALTRVRTIVFQSRGFIFDSSGEEFFQKERPMSLSTDIDSPDSFIKNYEASIVYKLRAAAGESRELSGKDVADALGVNWEDESSRAYCIELLRQALPGVQ
jgi:hypothetical protein